VIVMNVSILMGTYNGEKFIEEQIQSIIDQTYKQWCLYIQDDGSTDRTLKIIEQFAELYPKRIIILHKESSQHGAKENYVTLCEYMLHTEYPYIMFCDQDDVWKKDKIEVTIKKMKQEERDNKSALILVHTDLEVVDEKLNSIKQSYMKYRALDPQCVATNRLLMQNNVTGCTIMINRPLLQKAFKECNSERIAMHDWWVALIASLFGKIVYIDEATIQYRQHSNNVIGAIKVNSINFVINRLRDNAHVKKVLEMSINQAKELLVLCSNELSRYQYESIEALASIREKNKFVRIYTIFRHNLQRQGIVQVIGELLFI
jgi:glycosyltransferase involved in cell wall biosynthesis